MDSILKRVESVFKVVFEQDELMISEETCADDIEAWDSFKHLALIAMLEKEFNIKFEIDEIVSMECVGDIIKVLESRI